MYNTKNIVHKWEKKMDKMDLFKNQNFRTSKDNIKNM